MEKKTKMLIGIFALVLAVAVGLYVHGRSGGYCGKDEAGNPMDPSFFGFHTVGSTSHTAKCPNGLMTATWSGKSASTYGE